ncbi:MAG: ribonuclease H-like domain-containing protein [Candidatus Halalkalibacterium sp. M3_1C_030]
MKRKYLAFDIETAKILPENDGDLHSHRPLGISCAAVRESGKDESLTFFSTEEDGRPSLKMNQEDLTELIDYLLDRQEAGYTIVTHNGLGFDFDILAEESSRTEDCKLLARNHVDMMFHIFCEKGFGVALNAAAKAIGKSKPEGMSGSRAPRLWNEGNHQKVLDYVAKDCLLTLEVALKSEQEGSFQWITRKGRPAFMNLPNGWLTVEKAMKLPTPDTSWMDNPWPRSKFVDWLET